ncbi:MAG TPA: hypothetical protein VKF62_00710 [Planctomycetota bacterium]|nr:hypothetical protein [Planctomycetota bacterium]
MAASVSLALLALAAQDPASRPEEGWRADLDLLATELPKRHKDLYALLPREKWEAEVARLREAVPGMERHRFVVGLMRLVASLGDGHTSVGWPAEGFACPIAFEWLDDGVVVSAARGEGKALLGKRLVAIEGKPFDEVAQALRGILAHDNEAGFRNWATGFLGVPDVLEAIGVARGLDSVEYAVSSEGRTEAARIESFPRGRVPKDGWEKVVRPVPLCEERPQEAFWYRHLEPYRALYLKYNACRDPEGFRALVDRMWAAVEGKPLDRLVVDLRDNSGGASAQFKPLLDRLKEEPRLRAKGAIFGIVGPRTFSSAVLNALELRGQANARIAGSPTGGKPNHYGEVRTFQLPSTNLTVQYSTKFFRTVDGDPESVPFDLPAPTRIDDWLEGRDPVVEAVLAWKP